MTALLAHGLEVDRFAEGAVLTDGGLYYPTISLRRFAHALDCLGLAPQVLPALRDLTVMRSLHDARMRPPHYAVAFASR